MIKSIAGLSLPPSTKSKSEIVPNVTTKRTVNGRLIYKHRYDAWKCTFEMDENTIMTPTYQADFYGICISARTTPIEVVFVSPYDGQEKTATMLCTELNAPDILALSGRAPRGYSGVSATFEEVNPV